MSAIRNAAPTPEATRLDKDFICRVGRLCHFRVGTLLGLADVISSEPWTLRALLITAFLTSPLGFWGNAEAHLIVRVPIPFHLTTKNITTITQPVPRFVLYSGRFARRVAVTSPGEHQVLVILMEETNAGGYLQRDFPPRPRRFRISQLLGSKASKATAGTRSSFAITAAPSMRSSGSEQTPTSSFHRSSARSTLCAFPDRIRETRR